MRFPSPLLPARLTRRYKRFLADAVLEDGTEITAHCPNPGAMTGLAEPGQRIWLEPNDDPKKKLRYGWRLSETADGLVGIDAGRANAIVREGLDAGAFLPEVSNWRAEVRYGAGNRVDFLGAEPGGRPVYLEVKSVTLCRTAGLAEFPDTRTARGARHLGALSAVAAEGARAVLLYLVQRDDCDAFALASDIDPTYAEAARAAKDAGVEQLVRRCRVTPEGIALDQFHPIT